jgi:hypothetical protein
MLSADNQQERVRKNLNPWYIVGFVEGEGTFHVAFYKDPHMKQFIKVIPEFHVNQSYLRIETLEEIRRYFSCGYIKNNHIKNSRDTTYVYVVRDREDLLKKIIPFFEKYKFYSIKQESFKIFAKIVKQMARGRHRNKTGLQNIINLAYKMNVGGKYRLRKKEDLLQSLHSSETIR